MKITPSLDTLSPKRGMTLIELTVVILILLSLIGATFVGASAWKRGSDRSMSIILIRNAQMGLRSHCQMEGVETPTYLNLPEQVFGPNRYVSNGVDGITGLPKLAGELPDHPAKNLFFDYVAGDGDVIPAWGTLYICSGGSSDLNDFTYNPQPSVYEQW